MALSYIVAIESGDYLGFTSTLEGDTGDEPSVFHIAWNISFSVTGRVFEGNECDSIIGVRKISLPNIVVRGISVCAKVARVCTRDLIGEGSQMWLSL
jgi:hypothetical protein